MPGHSRRRRRRFAGHPRLSFLAQTSKEGVDGRDKPGHDGLVCPKSRLLRLPQERAVVVHSGLHNDGARIVAERVSRLRLPVPLGINLVVTNRGRNAPPLPADRIIAEYVDAARVLAPHADYLMLNLSCPNTEDGRDFFLDPAHLEGCLAALGELKLKVPVFLK